MYKSQYNQDKILNEKYFKNKKNGVFLDIGAHDGLTLSNTYFFEKELGWSGVCFEPNPSVFNSLKQNRNTLLINGCAWYENTKKTFRMVKGYSEMLSGIIDHYDVLHLNRIKNECETYGSTYEDIEVDCYDINKILIDNNIKDIDLISIDTEGSEFEIIKNINFNLFNIEFILVEDNYSSNQLDAFMKSKNYKLVERINIDKLYKKF
jgi:FkbM family methyltransferase